MGLVDDALGGSVRALARLATHIENETNVAHAALARLYPLSGRAHTIGITGPPGAGKSSLVNRIVARYRTAGKRVAVIAVDPTSPLTGGATLGDRIRMLDLQGDAGVFIRSTASRGRTGGLAPTTSGLIHLFDAVGFDVVIVETVGIGQEEIDVVHYVESVVLVQVPGLGDGIQALKAGVLEIADIYAVNKIDLPGAHGTVRELQTLLGLSEHISSWSPPVVGVSASEAVGIDELVDALNRQRAWLDESGSLRTRRRAIAAMEISQQVQRLFERKIALQGRSWATDELISNVAERTETPANAADSILAHWSNVT